MRIYNFAVKLYAHYQHFRPFTDEEAWGLFRLAAIGEGVGWTLLILGIFCRDVVWPGNQFTVAFAGRIHGILFMFYIAAALLLAPSLQWSFMRTIIAGLCSVPPYGSIAFEMVIGWQRRHQDFQLLYPSLYLCQLQK